MPGRGLQGVDGHSEQLKGASDGAGSACLGAWKKACNLRGKLERTVTVFLIVMTRAQFFPPFSVLMTV